MDGAASGGAAGEAVGEAVTEGGVAEAVGIPRFGLPIEKAGGDFVLKAGLEGEGGIAGIAHGNGEAELLVVFGEGGVAGLRAGPGVDGDSGAAVGEVVFLGGGAGDGGAGTGDATDGACDRRGAAGGIVGV